MLFRFARPVLSSMLLLSMLCAGCTSEGDEDAPVDSASTIKREPFDSKLWDKWRDAAAHSSHFASVNGIRLHYLVWEGTGDTLILLPGLGNSAHIYDELAPRLAGRFHVIALTPRGHGESSHPVHGYSIATFTDDLRAFLDKLGIDRPSLVAHSLGGAVITRFATLHPHRVNRLVYIDATGEYTRLDSALELRPFQRPAMKSSGGTARQRYRIWLANNQYGFWANALEADLRVSLLEQSAMNALLDDLTGAPIDYTKLQAPALAICAVATVESEFPWLTGTMTSSQREEAEEYLEEVMIPWGRAGCERFDRDARSSQMVELTGHHYLHVEHPDQVADEILEFLDE